MSDGGYGDDPDDALDGLIDDYGDVGGPPQTQAEFFARWYVAHVEWRADQALAHRRRKLGRIMLAVGVAIVVIVWARR